MITINIILLSILFLLACFILRQLIITRNGILRKIMIAYFATEIFFLAGFLYLEEKYGSQMLTATQWVLLVCLSPKVASKIIFFNYTNKKR